MTAVSSLPPRFGKYTILGHLATGGMAEVYLARAEGIEGFVDALDFDRVHEVRLADCWRNGHEVHLKPGAGNLDFVDMFKRVEGRGYRGRYTNAFGTLEDRLNSRDYLVQKAKEAGVNVD